MSEFENEQTPAETAPAEPEQAAPVAESAPVEVAPPAEAAPEAAPAVEAAVEAAPAEAPSAQAAPRPPREPRPPRKEGEGKPRGERPPRPEGERPPRPEGERPPRPEKGPRPERQERGDRPKGGGERREGGERRDDRGRPRDGRPGSRDQGRPFGRPDIPVDIEIEKLVADSLYLDNQAHAVVSRIREMDAGTRSQVRRLFSAVRRACRAAGSRPPAPVRHAARPPGLHHRPPPVAQPRPARAPAAAGDPQERPEGLRALPRPVRSHRRLQRIRNPSTTEEL